MPELLHFNTNNSIGICALMRITTFAKFDLIEIPGCIAFEEPEQGA